MAENERRPDMLPDAAPSAPSPRVIQRQQLTDRITQMLAKGTQKMSATETFAQVGRAAARAAASDVTFGDAYNAIEADRMKAAKQLSDFLTQERQLALQEQAGERAERQLGLQKQQFEFDKRKLAAELKTKKDEFDWKKSKFNREQKLAWEKFRLNERDHGIARGQLDIARRNARNAEERTSIDRQRMALDERKAITDIISKTIPESQRPAYLHALSQIDVDVNKDNVMTILGMLKPIVDPGIPREGPKLSDINTLRDDYTKASETFTVMRDSFAKMEAAAQDESGYGDVALIFSFMKMLDPDSVVRESEYGTVEVIGNIPDNIKRSYIAATKGEKLLPEQRAGILALSERYFRQAYEMQKIQEQTYTERAQRAGMNPDDVLSDVFGPYRYRGMSEAELINAIDRSSGENRPELEAEVARRFSETGTSATVTLPGKSANWKARLKSKFPRISPQEGKEKMDLDDLMGEGANE